MGDTKKLVEFESRTLVIVNNHRLSQEIREQAMLLGWRVQCGYVPYEEGLSALEELEKQI